MLIKKSCLHCGNSIIDNSSNNNRKYCNEHCRDQYRRHGSLTTAAGAEEYNKVIKSQKEDEMNLEKAQELELLEELSKRGYVSSKRDVLMNRHYKLPRQLKPFKIGVVSDTHLGSVCQQLTLLNKAYEMMAEEGIKTVLHCGDFVEGNGKQYKGQTYEMFVHGADSMVNYAVKAYPKIKGITTYVIGGSHDFSYYKADGMDVLKRISEGRPDIKYLGMSGAYMNFGKIVVYMFHPSGGVPYARSYRLQKTINELPSGKKPNILLAGHLHVTCCLPDYRNVAAFQVPCFQTQTQYLKEKGVSPDVGFLILEITPDIKGLSHYTSDWRPFYNPIEGDY